MIGGPRLPHMTNTPATAARPWSPTIRVGIALPSGELSDCLDEHLVQHDAYVVTALLRTRGVEVFEDEDPADDFGLGIVYERVRTALVDAGYLAVTA